MYDPLSEIDDLANPNIAALLSPFLNEDIQQDGGVASSFLPSARLRLLAELTALRHAYHNAGHALAVETRVQKLAQEAGCREEFTELLRIAALAHDLYHYGVPYRQLACGPDDPLAEYSNEEVAVLLVDDLLRGLLTIPQRIELQGLILATSFGQDDPDKVPKANLYRPYGPMTQGEKLLAFADVNVLEYSFQELVSASFSLLIENERLSEDAAVATFASGLVHFMQHVAERLDDVKGIISDEAWVRYEAGLNSLNTAIVALQNDADSPERKVYEQAYYAAIADVN